MQKRRSYLFIFVIFLIVLLIVISFSNVNFLRQPGGFVSTVFSPVRAFLFRSLIGTSPSKITVKEINSLKNDCEKIKEQNKSLLDQFQTLNPKSSTLLSADVVGAPSFIPSLSAPEKLIINRGKDDKIKTGQAVVFKDSLIGKIGKVNSNLAEVILVTNVNSSFTAVTGKDKNILGVSKGQGSGEMVLDNVLLSEDLKIGDFVFTKGDVNLNGEGVPPGLIVGKIISVEKKPSALFQKAQVEGAIDIAKLSTVFVITGQ